MQKTELEYIEMRLAELENERQSLLSKRTALLNSSNQLPQLNPSQKIDIYMGLFRGRDDIYAHRWQNKQGRSGYSVACHNEWCQGLCNKPQVRCMECVNQDFKRLDKHSIYGHLSGEQTLGLYPLLENDNCWLLAVDFDKSDWKTAAIAFFNACNEYSLPCSIERSRSGNGAHIWLFFETPILAKEARELGFILLNKAMEYHAGLSFESYD